MRIIKYLDYIEKINDKGIIKMLDEIEQVIGYNDTTMLAWYHDSGMSCGFKEFIKLAYKKDERCFAE